MTWATTAESNLTGPIKIKGKAAMCPGSSISSCPSKTEHKVRIDLGVLMFTAAVLGIAAAWRHPNIWNNPVVDRCATHIE